MLPKQYRLKAKPAFSATYKIKNSFYNGGIVMFVGKKKTDENFQTKIGFVVSKKTHKRAVKRNRLKRLMRESVRLILKNNQTPQIEEYMSIIFVGKSSALGKSFNEIDKSIKFMLGGLN